MSFKLVVKDGETDYKYNTKTGGYESKPVDSVNTFEHLAEALAEFLYSIEDYGTPTEDKVSLSYIPEKKGKKDKK